MNTHSVNIIMKKYISICFILVLISGQKVIAQKTGGTIEDTEITVEKERKINMPDLQKPRQKGTLIKPNPTENNKVVFDIPERKFDIKTLAFNPAVSKLIPQDTTEIGFENMLKVGAGNFGRLYFEGIANAPFNKLGSFGLNFKHNSAKTGPIYGNGSANGITEIGLLGQHIGKNIKLNALLNYDRTNLYFYGYKDRGNLNPEKSTFRQTFNKFGFNLGLENINQDSPIDYSLKTGIVTINDRFKAQELDWITKANFKLPVTQKFYALVDAEASVAQRSDSVSNNRNLLKVKPTFIWEMGKFALTIGLNAVNEVDVQKNIGKDINRTRAFPVALINYKYNNRIFLFVGYDGDIYKNSLASLVQSNPWLVKQVNLRNTEKKMDIYGGVKGEFDKFLNYDVKVGYAKYNNFQYFNHSNFDSTKFESKYGTGITNNFKINTNIYAKPTDFLRSTLKLEINSFDPSASVVLYHTPNVRSTWSNTLSFKNKLFIGTDLLFISKQKAFNPTSAKEISIKSIYDLNAKMNYQFTKHLSSFVYLNNILGKNYQVYNNYPVQGLNFLVGLQIGFNSPEW